MRSAPHNRGEPRGCGRARHARAPRPPRRAPSASRPDAARAPRNTSSLPRSCSRLESSSPVDQPAVGHGEPASARRHSPVPYPEEKLAELGIEAAQDAKLANVSFDLLDHAARLGVSRLPEPVTSDLEGEILGADGIEPQVDDALDLLGEVVDRKSTRLN